MMDDLENEFGLQEEREDDDESSDDHLSKGGRKSQLPLVNLITAETSKKSDFHESTRICLERIRKAMLHHRWQEAAENMVSFTQVLEETNRSKIPQTKELVWRISTEILHHLSNSTMDDYIIIYERMKHSGVRHYLTICLEKSFHLMLHGEIENARRELSAGESWRYGKESASQHHKFTLIQAYRSLLDYIIWCDKKSRQSTHPNSEDDQSMHRYFRQAAVNLQEVLKNPGVWDPFILCYIEMLEFYDDHEEALKILNNYAYDSSFPPNPNAHVYLYQYLKRHNAPRKKLLKVLKILQVLVPSHELMLEYISLLLKSAKTNAVQKALEVALAMLDFKCWKRNLDVWRHLTAIIQQMQTQENCQEAVVAVMAQRKDWWAAFHFTSMHATQDVKDNPELFQIKSSLSKVLYPDQTLRYTAGS